MEQLHEDEFPVILKALEQYKKILDELVKNEDPVMKINLFVEDLNNLSTKTVDLINDVTNGDKYRTLEDNILFIHAAVSSYLKYLQETMKYIYDKLGANPKLEFIETEIKSTQKVILKLSE